MNQTKICLFELTRTLIVPLKMNSKKLTFKLKVVLKKKLNKVLRMKIKSSIEINCEKELRLLRF